jgi:hypothetical protein
MSEMGFYRLFAWKSWWKQTVAKAGGEKDRMRVYYMNRFISPVVYIKISGVWVERSYVWWSKLDVDTISRNIRVVTKDDRGVQGPGNFAGGRSHARTQGQHKRNGTRLRHQLAWPGLLSFFQLHSIDLSTTTTTITFRFTTTTLRGTESRCDKIIR